MIHIHLQGILELLFRQIGQIGGIQVLCECIAHVGKEQRLAGGLKGMDQFRYPTQRDRMNRLNLAI